MIKTITSSSKLLKRILRKKTSLAASTAFYLMPLVLITFLFLSPQKANAVSTKDLIKQKREILKTMKQLGPNNSRYIQLQLELDRIQESIRVSRVQSTEPQNPVIPPKAQKTLEEASQISKESSRIIRKKLRISPVKISQFLSKKREVASNNTNQNTANAVIFESGLASYYADKFHGRNTASGETFSNNELTAAHKTLAFGSIVRVINKRNNKSIDVRITDRGPYSKGRVIDLTKYGFEQLDSLSRGLIEVDLMLISTP